MKMNKLSIIAILAISFAFFSCNEEESLTTLQSSKDGSKVTEADLSVETRATSYFFRVKAYPERIGANGGTVNLDGQISTSPDFPTNTVQSLANMVYTDPQPVQGFTLSNNQVIVDPIPSNMAGRFIRILGIGLIDDQMRQAYVTIYQNGIAHTDDTAHIGGIECKDNQIINLAPGTYECNAGGARETEITINGKGVSIHRIYHSINVSAGADAIVTLNGLIPGRPTVDVHIVSPE